MSDVGKNQSKKGKGKKSSKSYHSTCPAVKVNPENDSACEICHYSHSDDFLQCGEMYRIGEIYVHYFCVLFSAEGKQQGQDDEGVFGFLLKDIKAELKRSQRDKCIYCFLSKANIRCCRKGCSATFHYRCGQDYGCTFQFRGNFRAFCDKHRQKQNPGNFPAAPDKMCFCLEEVCGDAKFETLISPCCGRYNHTLCVQRMAKYSGEAHTKCPWCNDKHKFIPEILRMGIFVPIADAAWEKEDSFYNFQDHYNTGRTCQLQDKCLCEEGPKWDKRGTKWEVILCDWCGNNGIHVECGELDKSHPEFGCSDCAQCVEPDKSQEQFRLVDKSKFRPMEFQVNIHRLPEETPRTVVAKPTQPANSKALLRGALKNRVTVSKSALGYTLVTCNQCGKCIPLNFLSTLIKHLEVHQVEGGKDSRGCKVKKFRKGKKMRRQRCHTCDGCRREDCKKCEACKDMKKYGGKNRLKQACVTRICRKLCPNEPDDDGLDIEKDTQLKRRNVTKVQCPSCNKEFKFKIGLKHHIEKVHSHVTADKNDTSTSPINTSSSVTKNNDTDIPPSLPKDIEYITFTSSESENEDENTNNVTSGESSGGDSSKNNSDSSESDGDSSDHEDYEVNSENDHDSSGHDIKQYDSDDSICEIMFKPGPKSKTKNPHQGISPKSEKLKLYAPKRPLDISSLDLKELLKAKKEESYIGDITSGERRVLWLLWKHLDGLVGQRDFSCPQCQERFEERWQLCRHLSENCTRFLDEFGETIGAKFVEVGVTPYIFDFLKEKLFLFFGQKWCLICGRVLSTSFGCSLQNHLVQNHLKKLMLNDVQETDSNAYVCIMPSKTYLDRNCGRHFSSLTMMLYHLARFHSRAYQLLREDSSQLSRFTETEPVKEFHNDAALACPKCGLAAMNGSSLNIHLASHQKHAILQGRTGGGKCIVEGCHANSMFSQEELVRHYGLVHMEPRETSKAGSGSRGCKRVVCPSFTERKVEVKEGGIVRPTPFQCVRCYKAFRTNEELNVHKKTHVNNDVGPSKDKVCEEDLKKEEPEIVDLDDSDEESSDDVDSAGSGLETVDFLEPGVSFQITSVCSLSKDEAIPRDVQAKENVDIRPTENMDILPDSPSSSEYMLDNEEKEESTIHEASEPHEVLNVSDEEPNVPVSFPTEPGGKPKIVNLDEENVPPKATFSKEENPSPQVLTEGGNVLSKINVESEDHAPDKNSTKDENVPPKNTTQDPEGPPVKVESNVPPRIRAKVNAAMQKMFGKQSTSGPRQTVSRPNTIKSNSTVNPVSSSSQPGPDAPAKLKKRPWRCPVCQATFRACSTLKTHMGLLHFKTRLLALVSEISPFVCPQSNCKQKFPSREAVVQHLVEGHEDMLLHHARKLLPSFSFDDENEEVRTECVDNVETRDSQHSSVNVIPSPPAEKDEVEYIGCDDDVSEEEENEVVEEADDSDVEVMVVNEGDPEAVKDHSSNVSKINRPNDTDTVIEDDIEIIISDEYVGLLPAKSLNQERPSRGIGEAPSKKPRYEEPVAGPSRLSPSLSSNQDSSRASVPSSAQSLGNVLSSSSNSSGERRGTVSTASETGMSGRMSGHPRGPSTVRPVMPGARQVGGGPGARQVGGGTGARQVGGGTGARQVGASSATRPVRQYEYGQNLLKSTTPSQAATVESRQVPQVVPRASNQPNNTLTIVSRQVPQVGSRASNQPNNTLPIVSRQVPQVGSRASNQPNNTVPVVSRQVHPVGSRASYQPNVGLNQTSSIPSSQSQNLVLNQNRGVASNSPRKTASSPGESWKMTSSMSRPKEVAVANEVEVVSEDTNRKRYDDEIQEVRQGRNDHTEIQVIAPCTSKERVLVTSTCTSREMNSQSEIQVISPGSTKLLNDINKVRVTNHSTSKSWSQHSETQFSAPGTSKSWIQRSQAQMNAPITHKSGHNEVLQINAPIANKSRNDDSEVQVVSPDERNYDKLRVNDSSSRIERTDVVPPTKSRRVVLPFGPSSSELVPKVAKVAPMSLSSDTEVTEVDEDDDIVVLDDEEVDSDGAPLLNKPTKYK